jgi:hypothetical protein
MTNNQPNAIRHLVGELERLGYWTAEARSDDENFGDKRILLMKEGLGVRITRDRGQWFAEASGPGLADWFSPMVWMSYLNGRVGDTSTPSLDDQVRLLLENLDRIESASYSDPDILATLRTYRSARASQRRTGLSSP